MFRCGISHSITKHHQQLSTPFSQSPTCRSTTRPCLRPGGSDITTSSSNTYRSVKHGTLLSLCAGVITFTCILQSAGLTTISVIYSSEACVTLACLAVGSVSAHRVGWTVVVTSTGVYLLIAVTSSHTRVGTSTGRL